MTITEHIPHSVFSADAWTEYRARLEFTGKIVGGSPSDPKLIEGWYQSKLGITDEEQKKAFVRKQLAEVHGLDPGEATDADILKAVEEGTIEQKAQVFKRTPDGQPYMEGRQIKAMIKEATNIVAPYPEKWGRVRKEKGGFSAGKTPMNFIAERVWVPERPYVIADDSDGFELAVGHVPDGFGGTRSTIGYFEYVIRPVLEFSLEVLDDCITSEQWARIFSAAERQGLGARRSQGAGQFVVTSWEKSD